MCVCGSVQQKLSCGWVVLKCWIALVTARELKLKPSSRIHGTTSSCNGQLNVSCTSPSR